MSDHDNSHASASAVKDAQMHWESFIKGALIVGGIAALILVFMAVFLV